MEYVTTSTEPLSPSRIVVPLAAILGSCAEYPGAGAAAWELPQTAVSRTPSDR